MLNPWFRDEDDDNDPLAFFVGVCNYMKILVAACCVIGLVACIPVFADWLAGVIVRWGW